MRVKRNKRFIVPINAPVVVTLLGIVVVLAYSVYVARPFIQGPSITVNEPGQTIDGTVYMSGETKRVSKLSINELEVPITDTGSFAVERAFPPGYTVVTIRASDRFGRSKEEILTFVTQEYATEKESNIIEKESGEERAGDENGIEN